MEIQAQHTGNAKKQQSGIHMDMISLLPDEILFLILSFLTMREAAMMSILSHRWHKIWTSYPVLNFKVSDGLQYLNENNNQEWLHMAGQQYVKWVNSVIGSYQGDTVEELAVEFDLCGDYKIDVDRWVSFAMEKKVQRFTLNLSGYTGYRYPFPATGNIVKRLRSRIVGFTSTSLKVLELKCVNITGKSIRYLLSTCLSLEVMSIENSSELVCLEVAGRYLHLKCLAVVRCIRLKSICLSAPNLSTFNCVGAKVRIAFLNVPKLSQVCIGGTYLSAIGPAISCLAEYALPLETLVLDVRRTENNIQLHKFPVLARVKRLKLIVAARGNQSLLVFSPLFVACPNIYKLELEIGRWASSIASRAQAFPEFTHECLKVVEFVGFAGHNNDVELASYLIKIAVKLEKMIIVPHGPSSITSWWNHGDEDNLRMARTIARQLQDRFSLGDKLVLT